MEQNLQPHATPEVRNRYLELLEKAKENPKENELAIQLATLALKLDEKGEFWKFSTVFS